MKKINLFLFPLVISGIFAYGQNTDKDKSDTVKKFGISFSGFIQAEAAYDSRQVLQSREQMLVLYPLNVSLDKNGKDINAHPSLNQYAMSSRLIGKITGPDAFGAKTSALLEGDFTGPSSVENNAFRLRHAYIKLRWTKSELLMGQYWHPLNVPEMLPSVISLNTGAPFHPFSRQPQVRFTHNFGKFSLIAAVISNRDYTSYGPSGAVSDYLRNSVIPEMHLQLQFNNEDKFFCGFAGDYKKLTPRLKTDSTIIANESIDCYAVSAFVKVKTGKLTFKLQSVLGQNLYDQFMIGGIAVQKMDTATNHLTYTNLNQLSAWLDISTNFKKFNACLFGGYAKNLGSLHNIWGKYYSRGEDIAYLYRVSPRLTWTSGNFTVASEFEYTVAAYGKPDFLDNVKDAKEYANLRVLIAATYNF